MSNIDAWRSLAEGLLRVASEVFDKADIPVTAQGARHPKVIALTLLARTISNFEAVLLMLDSDHIVEARTLVRCCWENLFWIAALEKKGAEFVKEIEADDSFSRRKRAGRLSTWSKDQAQPQEFEARLAQLMADLDNKDAKLASIKHAGAATTGGIPGGYIIYGELSTDSAHPSAVSLSRHVTVDGTDFTIHARAASEPDKVEQTLEFGCGAMLSVATAAGRIVESSVLLTPLYDEFVSLSNRSKA